MEEKLKEMLYYLRYFLITTWILCISAHILLGAVYLVVNYPSHVAVVAFLCVIFGLYVDRLYFLSKKWK